MSYRNLNKVKSMMKVCGGAAFTFSLMCFYQENEKLYNNCIIPLAHQFDPEFSHKLAVFTQKYRLIPKSSYLDTPEIETKLWNIKFQNILGVAAGFDKNGEAIENLHDIGFGFVEIGSVTPKPQDGNSKPRVFRLKEDCAVINRYGFNSDGHDVVLERINKVKENNFKGVIGVNLGKNKLSNDPIQDYVDGIKLFGPVADYLVINISSPNTPGLRDWQKREQLENLLKRLMKARNDLKIKIPLLVKISPDLSEFERKEMAEVFLKPDCRIDGMIISNTTTNRSATLKSINANEEGGLSGRPITDLSTNLIFDMYKFTKGKIPIIGVGGIFTGEDAYEKIISGASLLEIYTSFIYHGPPRIRKIKQELKEILKNNGYSCVEDAVGKNHKTF